MDELPNAKNDIRSKLIDDGERQETIETGYEVLNELTRMENWLNEETSKFSHYLRFAAKEFKEADKLV
ncbi:hypothetical protein DFO73_10911 [Cytobacillus oceanisediminis]|jgi:hypothetical protein|uniref:Uncharacterized protein n=1 Tax=Cytobacillus oceanisediminis TaxID=665099 RepID=A0A2V2ZR76_9BACI|nr:hypothetical protein [Cytobacillus oceanisediminis]PWW26848.1 hypothetical protein DFO73_10911 [Cytobacillus oceanisediminis]